MYGYNTCRQALQKPDVGIDYSLSSSPPTLKCALHKLVGTRYNEGREAYEGKRQKILRSATSLVEIDLNRAGNPMPIVGDAGTGYRILVSRGYCRPDADLYAFGLKDPIPAFPVPLRQEDPDPVVDLQSLLNEVYERARFDLAIDYLQPVKPPLPPEEAGWVTEILRGGDR